MPPPEQAKARRYDALGDLHRLLAIDLSEVVESIRHIHGNFEMRIAGQLKPTHPAGLPTFRVEIDNFDRGVRNILTSLQHLAEYRHREERGLFTDEVLGAKLYNLRIATTAYAATLNAIPDNPSRALLDHFKPDREKFDSLNADFRNFLHGKVAAIEAERRALAASDHTHQRKYIPIREAATQAFEQSGIMHNCDVTAELRIRHHIFELIIDAERHPERLSIFGCKPPSRIRERVPPERLNTRNLSDDGSILIPDRNHPDRIDYSDLCVLASELKEHVERLKAGTTAGQQPP